MLTVPLRSYWPQLLPSISKAESGGIKQWLLEAKNYSIHSDITDTKFEIQTYHADLFLRPITFDINRLICASVESASTKSTTLLSPKSNSWNLIHLYYSAFFAANTILRIFGHSLTFLDRQICSSITKTAALYGHKNNANLKKGLYLLDYQTANSVLTGTRRSNSNGGSHESAWKVFIQFIRKVQVDISTEYGLVYADELAKLRELELNLTNSGSTEGNWLSTFRNEINYSHLHGVWFPYQNYALKKRLENSMSDWLQKPMDIDLRTSDSSLVMKFQATCMLIVSWAITLSTDMSNRPGANGSFHKTGIVRIMNLLRE